MAILRWKSRPARMSDRKSLLAHLTGQIRIGVLQNFIFVAVTKLTLHVGVAIFILVLI
jgi:hypothetical protein